MNILVKHAIRLKNTVRRHLGVIELKIKYGKQVQMGKFHFRDGFNVYVEGNGKLKIGDNCFFNNYCSITARDSIKIGNNCIFGENVKIYDHNHCYNDKDLLICKQGFSAKEVVIEDDCWIGSNVVILKGVHIGRHSVVGAGVVIYKDLPANSVVVCKQSLVSIKER